MNKEGGFIKNIVIISAILGTVFLSQQSLFKSNTKNYIYSQGAKAGNNNIIKKAGDWFNDNVYLNASEWVSGEVAKNNAAIELTKEEIEKQKNNLEKNSIDTAKKFIAEKFLQTMGVKPEDLLTPDQLVCPK